MARTKVTLEGPLFDGRADAAARELADALAAEAAEIGQYMIKMDTDRMDKSGRGGTGRAAGGVELKGADGTYRVSGGIREGEYAWPWLEGTSKRNASTGFKGYHSFRRARLRMRKQAPAVLQPIVDAFMARMGGEP